MKQCAMIACERIAEKRSYYCYKHNALCIIPGCKNHNRTMGMCNRHYNNYWRKQKRTLTNHLCVYPDCTDAKGDDRFCPTHRKLKIDYRTPQKCAVPWCEEMFVKDAHCEEHYSLFANTGAPVKMIKLCGYPACGEPHSVRGMCQKHYAQWQRSYLKFQEEGESI